MDNLSASYLQTILQDQVLRFGSFTTKSGRQSPYFFNTGNICTAHSISTVAQAYAQRIFELHGAAVDNFFGPAYKGIPLAVTVVQQYAALASKNVSFTFNRKEQKDHGEGGSYIGAPFTDGMNVVIVEDVLTAGTSLRESLTQLQHFPVKVNVLSAVVGVDRQEKGTADQSAAQEIAKDFGVPVHALLTLDAIVEALWNQTVNGKVWINDETKVRIDEYRARHCAAP